MSYTKPQIIAENKAQGSFAAGCPTNKRPTMVCENCELTQ